VDVPTLDVAERQTTDGFIDLFPQSIRDVGTLKIQFVSSEWESVPGVTVTVAIQESRDNGQTWPRTLAALSAPTGPLPAPPRNVLPSTSGTYGGSVPGDTRLRAVFTVSAPLRIGAAIEYLTTSAAASQGGNPN
jgi:hypothetical protein